jgi:hypothetical protein
MSDIHLAQRMSGHRAQDSGLSPNLFRLPLESARQKAREIIGQTPRNGFVTFVERWRHLPDFQIEFSVRRQLVVK